MDTPAPRGLVARRAVSRHTCPTTTHLTMQPPMRALKRPALLLAVLTGCYAPPTTTARPELPPTSCGNSVSGSVSCATPVGARVRLFVRSDSSGRTRQAPQGAVVQLLADSVAIRLDNNDMRMFAFRQVDHIDRLHQHSNVRRGAKWGAYAGAVAAMVFAANASCHGPNDAPCPISSRLLMAWYVALPTAAIGAGAGAIVGAASPRADWVTVWRQEDGAKH